MYDRLPVIVLLLAALTPAGAVPGRDSGADLDAAVGQLQRCAMPENRTSYKLVLVALVHHLRHGPAVPAPLRASSAYLQPEHFHLASVTLPDGLSTAAVTIASLRYLLETDRCWLATILFQKMPKVLLNAAPDALHGGGSGALSLMAATFEKLLDYPNDVNEKVYFTLLEKVEPRRDTIALFYDRVVLPGTFAFRESARLIRLRSVWTTILYWAPLADVVALARRQSAVLDPASWSWTFYVAVVRISRDRLFRARHAAEAVQFFRCDVRGLLDPACAALDRYVQHVLVNFALCRKWKLADVLAGLESRKLPWSRVSLFSPFGVPASEALQTYFDELLVSQVISLEDVISGLRAYELTELIATVNRLYIVYPRNSVNKRKWLIAGEMHAAILRFPGAVEAYKRLCAIHGSDDVLAEVASALITRMAHTQQVLSRALRGGQPGAERDLYFNLLALCELLDPFFPDISIYLRQCLNDMTSDISLDHIAHYYLASLPHNVPLSCRKMVLRSIMRLPAEGVSWDYIYQSLVALPLASADPIPAELERPIFTAFWLQTFEQIAAAEVPERLEPVLYKNYLKALSDVPRNLTRDDCCPICTETLLFAEEQYNCSCCSPINDSRKRKLCSNLEEVIKFQHPTIRSECGHFYHQRCVAVYITHLDAIQQATCSICRQQLAPDTE